eukprot:1615555-Rhodomonas_salina.1
MGILSPVPRPGTPGTVCRDLHFGESRLGASASNLNSSCSQSRFKYTVEGPHSSHPFKFHSVGGLRWLRTDRTSSSAAAGPGWAKAGRSWLHWPGQPGAIMMPVRQPGSPSRCRWHHDHDDAGHYQLEVSSGSGCVNMTPPLGDCDPDAGRAVISPASPSSLH